MLNQNQLRELIIVPVLNDLQMYSKSAEELLVFTCAVESDGGTFLKQVKGPALGIYQMEPATHTDIWQNFIRYRTNIVTIMSLMFQAPSIPKSERLIYDLRYATAMARLHYRRFNERLPNEKDPKALYAYYKKYYNTPEGKSTEEKSIAKYNQFLGKKAG